MKRRDMLKTLPAAALGMTLAGKARAEESPFNKGYTSSLACAYIGKVADMLTRIRETQMENMMAAAFTAARTSRAAGPAGASGPGPYGERGSVRRTRRAPVDIHDRIRYQPFQTGDMFLTNISAETVRNREKGRGGWWADRLPGDWM